MTFCSLGGVKGPTLLQDPALSSTTPEQPQLKASGEHEDGPPPNMETTGPVQETDPAPQTQVDHVDILSPFMLQGKLRDVYSSL